MAIKLTAPNNPQSLTYDRLFLISLNIEQVQDVVDSNQPVYSFLLRYKVYAIDSSGNRVYNNKVYTINVPDYLTDAIAKASSGDNTLLAAVSAIEKAMSLLVTDKSNLGNAGVI